MNKNKILYIDKGMIIKANSAIIDYLQFNPIGISIKEFFTDKNTNNKKISTLFLNSKDHNSWWINTSIINKKKKKNIIAIPHNNDSKWIWEIYIYTTFFKFISSQLSDGFFNYLPDPLVILDSNSNIVFANSLFLKTFGYSSKSEVLNHNIDDLVVPEKYKESGIILSKSILKGKRMGTDDVPRKKKDGSIVWVTAAGGPIYFKNNKKKSPIGTIAIYRNVDKRHQKRILKYKENENLKKYYKDYNKALSTDNLNSSISILTDSLKNTGCDSFIIKLNLKYYKIKINKGKFSKEDIINNINTNILKKISLLKIDNYSIFQVIKILSKTTIQKLDLKNNLLFLYPISCQLEDILDKNKVFGFIAILLQNKINFDTEKLLFLYCQSILNIIQNHYIKIKHDISNKTEVLLQTAGSVSHHLNQPLTVAILAASYMKDQIKDPMIAKNIDSLLSALTDIDNEIKKIKQITSYKTEDYYGDTKIIIIG